MVASPPLFMLGLTPGHDAPNNSVAKADAFVNHAIRTKTLNSSDNGDTFKRC
jgi:hypothetical protein